MKPRSAPLLTALVLGLAASFARSTPIFSPGDPIQGGQVIGTEFVFGTSGFNLDDNNWPPGESPDHAIDGVGQKYLNFGKTGTGILVTPAAGPSVASALKLWTANDATPRDPRSYEVWGSNAAVAGDRAALADFTLLASGPLALPSERTPGGSSPLIAASSRTVYFNNTQPYSSYLIVFPEVKDAGFANSMQIAEVQLLRERLVTTTANSGPGSLRRALADAAVSGPSGIRFDPSLFNGEPDDTISLGSVLNISGLNVSIDASDIPGGVTLDGGGSVQALVIQAGANATLRSLHVRNANALSAGGGVLVNSSTALIEGCTFTSCHSGNGGGAIAASGSTLLLLNSTLDSNSAVFAGGLVTTANTEAEIVHCSITRNSGEVCCGGMALRGPVTMTNTIVAENTAPAGTAWDINKESDSITVANSLVGRNTSMEALIPAGTPNAQQSYAGTAASPLSPKLAELNHNGGTTPTRLPLPGSSAIDHGAPLATPVADQIGRPRTLGIAPDIGAVEISWGLELTASVPAVLEDVTSPGSPIVAVPASAATSAGEDVDRLIDNLPGTKFYTDIVANATVGISPLLGISALNGVTFTSGNDAINRDPRTFLLLGTNGSPDGGYQLIATGEIPDFPGRMTKQSFYLAAEAPAFRHYRVVFPSTRFGEDFLFTEGTQLAELELLGRPTDPSLRLVGFTCTETGSATFPKLIQLTAVTQPGRTYALEYSGRLDGTWNRWWTGLSPQGYVTLFEFYEPPVGRRFHRIVEEEPP